MVECSISTWTTTYIHGEVHMTTESCVFASPIQMPGGANARSAVSYDTQTSLRTLFDERDIAFETLLDDSYDSEDLLKPLAAAARERSRPCSEMSLLYEVYGLLPDFDHSYFLRIVQSRIKNGDCFLRSFKDSATREDAEALLLWASSLDTALTKYAQICLPSLPHHSVERRKVSSDDKWTVRVRPLTLDLPNCAG